MPIRNVVQKISLKMCSQGQGYFKVKYEIMRRPYQELQIGTDQTFVFRHAQYTIHPGDWESNNSDFLDSILIHKLLQVYGINIPESHLISFFHRILVKIYEIHDLDKNSLVGSIGATIKIITFVIHVNITANVTNKNLDASIFCDARKS